MYKFTAPETNFSKSWKSLVIEFDKPTGVNLWNFRKLVRLVSQARKTHVRKVKTSRTRLKTHLTLIYYVEGGVKLPPIPQLCCHFVTARS